MLWSLALAAYAIDVHVVEDPRRDRWEATWSHDEPVRGFAFARNRNPVQEGWKASKGRIQRLGDRLVWLAPKGGTATSFTASFRTDTGFQTKDYELNVAFGDGARLLYTDHLFVLPLVCPDGAAACDDDALVPGPGEVHAWTVTTTPDRFVLTPDGRTAGEGTWRQTAGGVYLYVGDGEPLPDERVNFLIDPTTPEWVVARCKEWVGPLFDHYEAQTGRTLSFTPTILLSYEEGEAGEMGLGGGGLPGQMQMQIRGRGWAEETEATRHRFAHFLAHETFHMWNGEELSTDIDGSEEWLSEGSAELFATWATEALGVIDGDAARDEAIGYATSCASGHSGPLLVAHRRGNYGAFYTCGAAGLYQLHGALKPHGGLPAAMQQVFAEGDAYSTYDLLEAAHRLSGDPLATAFLERLLRSGLGGDPTASWASALSKGGPSVTTVDAWEAEGLGDDVLHDVLVQTIGDCDCGGSVSVWNHGDRLVFDPLDACDALVGGLEVTDVAGGSVSPRRDAVTRAWAAIDAGDGLVLSGPNGEAVLTCGDGVARPKALVPAAASDE